MSYEITDRGACDYDDTLGVTNDFVMVAVPKPSTPAPLLTGNAHDLRLLLGAILSLGFVLFGRARFWF